jgi:hypothetical protein
VPDELVLVLRLAAVGPVDEVEGADAVANGNSIGERSRCRMAARRLHAAAGRAAEPPPQDEALRGAFRSRRRHSAFRSRPPGPSAPTVTTQSRHPTVVTLNVTAPLTRPVIHASQRKVNSMGPR